MDLHSAQVIALEMLKENGLSGWIFAFDRSKRRFGCCNHTRKRITVSSHITVLNNEAEFRDTMAHEIAHALLAPGSGHGREWKQQVRKLGAPAKRCFDDKVRTPRAPFIGRCPSCGKSTGRFRRTKVACLACCRKYNGGRYSDSFRIVFIRAPKEG